MQADFCALLTVNNEKSYAKTCTALSGCSPYEKKTHDFIIKSGAVENWNIY
jgi:hypothetical protein